MYCSGNPIIYKDPTGHVILPQGNDKVSLSNTIRNEFPNSKVANLVADVLDKGKAVAEKVFGKEPVLPMAYPIEVAPAAGSGLIKNVVDKTKGLFNKSADDTVNASTKAGTEVVQRAMSKAELVETQKTGLIRGGKEGTHYVSDAVNSTANRARQRLAIPNKPEVRVSMEVPEGKFSAPSKVEPFDVKPGKILPGGGNERTATGNIAVKILDILKY